MISMKKQGVELYRFIMTITICLHHFRLYAELTLPFGGGYLAVDFFFILSGYFLYEHGVKKDANCALKATSETVLYAMGRYKRLFPKYVAALILSISIYIFVIQEDMDFMHLVLLIAKFLMVDGIFVQTTLNVMPQGWYCSVLWIGSAVVYFLFIKYREVFIKSISLYISVGIYICLFLQYGFLNLYTQYGFCLAVGLFRGIAGLCLGCMLGNVIDSEGGNGIKSKWINIVLFVSFTSIVLYALLWDTAYRKSDYAIVLVFIGILYYLLGDNDISRFLNRFSFSFLGRISYSMFLVHHFIAVLFAYYDWFREWDWKIVSMVYLGAVIVCAFLLEKFMEIVKWKLFKIN